MTDMDMLYDYYTGVSLASGGYAAMSCRIKDDKTETLFRKLAQAAMNDSREAAKLIIGMGGRIY